MNEWTNQDGPEHSPQTSLPKGKANGRTTKIWESIKESNDLFRLEWLPDFSYSFKSPFSMRLICFLDFIT